MAEPVTKKIDTLPAMEEPVATNDKLLILDVSDPATTMTKLITMNQVRISATAQLDANVVENAKIKDGAISTSKLDQTAGSQAVATGTIRDNAVTFAKVQDVDGYSVVGRSGSTAGDANEITAGENTVLGRVGSGNVAFNKLATTQLANTNARTVIGNATNASATPSAIASNTNGYVLRQNGDTLGFGTLTDKSLAAGAVTAGKIAAGGISASNQFAAQVVDTNAIKDGAVTSQKLSESFLPDNTAGSIELGWRRTSSGSAYLDFHSFYPINDYDARIISTNGQAGVVGKATLTYYAQSHNFSGTINGTLADNIVGNAQIANAVVTNDKLAAEVINDINKNLVYIQLFQPDEAIITTSAKAYFFVPSYLAGKKVKQLGIGIVSSSTGKTVTVALGSSYGSVSGVTSAETANTLNYTLPAALTKIPINVTVKSGTPAPKGLDLWFLVY